MTALSGGFFSRPSALCKSPCAPFSVYWGEIVSVFTLYCKVLEGTHHLRLPAPGSAPGVKPTLDPDQDQLAIQFVLQKFVLGYVVGLTVVGRLYFAKTSELLNDEGQPDDEGCMTQRFGGKT